jgi:hypothetical protein
MPIPGPGAAADAVDRRKPAEKLDADVLVVGGGAAGLAAAVTAARQGLKAVLLERYGFCGGAAVAGLSGTICGLYAATDDAKAPPRQLVHGFVDDFIRAIGRYDGLTPPIRYGKTFTRTHDPLAWRRAADDLIEAAGVRVLYHSTVTEALVEGGERIAGARAFTKEGAVRVQAALTVDASGDADLVAMAGFETVVGDDGRVQNPTMIFRLQDVDLPRFLAAQGEDSILGQAVTDEIVRLHNSREYDLPRSKIFVFPTPRPGELLCNCTRIVGRDGRELNPLMVADVTEAEIMGRRQAAEYARFFKDRLPGCERSWISQTGVQVGVRQTRQIVGERLLSTDDVLAHRKDRDAIALSAWPVELHSGAKPRIEWVLDDHYEIPFGCFVPKRGESLLVAGRCLSADHVAMASARVTAQCFAYGQAIGHAAALAVRERISPRNIKGSDIRTLMNRDGARLDG